MSHVELGDRLISWALAEPSVQLLVQIGSRTRPAGELGAADAYSDWDFQLATTNLATFATPAWTKALAARPLAYVLRPGRLGSAQKVTALFAEGALDLVQIPTRALQGVAKLVAERQLGKDPAAKSALDDLAAVLCGGYRILKGADEFAGLYEFVVREIPPARLSDDAVCAFAEGFVCDYVSAHRKIARGELLAAQRWLHHELAEVNFRLLHELRLRGSARSFPDARRLESFADGSAERVRVSATPEPAVLARAADEAAQTCREFMQALVGDRWQWPDLSPLRLRAE